MSNDLIHEIEESLKQERLTKIWYDYGRYLLAGAVLLVLCTAFFTGWQSWNNKTNAYNTSILLEAIDQQNGAEELVTAMVGFQPGQHAIALFTVSGQLIRNGKYDEALLQYEKAAKDKTLPKLFRDLATLMAVRLEWSQNDALGEREKQAISDSLLERLQPLLVDDKTPWRWHAYIQAALIKAHEHKDYSAAREYLLPVITAGNNIPQSLIERARALDHLYALQKETTKTEIGIAKEENPEG